MQVEKARVIARSRALKRLRIRYSGVAQLVSDQQILNWQSRPDMPDFERLPGISPVFALFRHKRVFNFNKTACTRLIFQNRAMRLKILR